MEFTRYTPAENQCIEATGYKPYSGSGIINYDNGTALIRSVGNTPYYADRMLTDGIAYTLQGREGDQSLEIHANKKLLQPGRRIFLLEVHGQKKNKKWVWHGEYTYTGVKEELTHPDIHGIPRKIYLVILKKVV